MQLKLQYSQSTQAEGCTRIQIMPDIFVLDTFQKCKLRQERKHNISLNLHPVFVSETVNNSFENN